jgi:hypothetical protein
MIFWAAGDVYGLLKCFVALGVSFVVGCVLLLMLLA